MTLQITKDTGNNYQYYLSEEGNQVILFTKPEGPSFDPFFFNFFCFLPGAILKIADIVYCLTALAPASSFQIRCHGHCVQYSFMASPEFEIVRSSTSTAILRHNIIDGEMGSNCNHLCFSTIILFTCRSYFTANVSKV